MILRDNAIYKTRTSFISHNDHEFLGDDNTLIAELDRRTSKVSTHVEVNSYDVKNTSLPDEVLLNETVFVNRPQRRNYDDIGHYSGDPKNYTLNFKILDMIRQAIYSTQFQLGTLDTTLDKYRESTQFRVGYIFRKLDSWLYDMKVIWSVVSKTRAFDKDPRKRRFRTYKQLLYYATMLRRDIDITYLVEEIIRIQNELHEKMSPEEGQ